ncbi:hypothetical protein PHMEG_00016802 [Phytophthora megakarya]|uniref:Ankyrin repeat-containing domain n=1 Tax=Phytophthora megakarya TaxID=4795 RepID=A0A225VZG5_9STRA|nr:hypothetical protein PHMEG_00016802 [Phytophthora megakarya]
MYYGCHGLRRSEWSFESREVVALKRNEGCTPAAITNLTKPKIQQWLRKTRKYIVKSTDATKRKRMDVGEWLHQNDGFATMENAAADGNLKALKWLYTNQAGKCSATALKMAVQGCHMQVVRWLIAHFEEFPIMEAMELAICGNHFEMALFIWSQHLPHANNGFMRTLRDKLLIWRYLNNRDILAWLEELV